MYQRRKSTAKLAGVLCIMLVFLFTAITYAECVGGDICVDSPLAGDELVSGDASSISLTIDPTAPRFATQYRLYLCCCSGSCTPSCTQQKWGDGIINLQMCDPNASRFSYKLGNPNSGCPDIYLWEVPFVPEVGASCRLAAVLLDANVNPLVTTGHVIGTGTSGIFKIKPFGAPSVALTLSPGSATVGPGGPSGLAIGKANYEISGGVPPFTVYVGYVGTTPPPPAINNYITINGNPVYPGQKFYGPLTFTLTNKFSDPCTDRTVNVAVRDSALTTATASYVINCLPY